jgi:chaperone modulatory protein CbpM
MTHVIDCLIVENINPAQLAQACHVEVEWVNTRLLAGLLTPETPLTVENMLMNDLVLQRARRMRAIERDFDANPELSALVVDMIEEISNLKCQLRAAGLPTD